MNVDIFLEHYGVKGMQWGVRRAQARQLSAKAKKKAGIREPTRREKREINKRKSAAANRRTLTDSDLDSFINRLEKEKKLNKLVREDVSPGRNAARVILGDSGGKVARNVVAGAATLLIAKKFGDTVARGGLKKK